MEEKDIKALNIYEKLLLITDEIGVIEKNLNVQVNKTASYKAVSERDVLDKVKPIEKKYRVYSYPVKREVIDRDILVKESEYNGNTTRTNTLFMRLETTYRFVNIDKPEEYVETTVYGDGVDTGDKAPGKAMTYADKYALMKAYKLSTGDDPDKDASPEKGYRKAKEVSQDVSPIELPVTATPKQVAILLQAYKGKNLEKLLAKYEISKLEELPIEKASELCKIILDKVNEEKEFAENNKFYDVQD